MYHESSNKNEKAGTSGRGQSDPLGALVSETVPHPCSKIPGIQTWWQALVLQTVHEEDLMVRLPQLLFSGHISVPPSTLPQSMH